MSKTDDLLNSDSTNAPESTVEINKRKYFYREDKTNRRFNVIGFHAYDSQPTFMGGVLFVSGVMSTVAESARKSDIDRKSKATKLMLLLVVIVYSIAQLTVAIFGMGRLGIMLLSEEAAMAKVYALPLLLLATLFILGSLRLLPPMRFLFQSIRGHYAE